jgi:hypothetical protein
MAHFARFLYLSFILSLSPNPVDKSVDYFVVQRIFARKNAFLAYLPKKEAFQTSYWFL